MSTDDLIALFHHRWAPPALALLGERGGARFVELQRRLDVGRESLRRALDALIELGPRAPQPGYGHPLRPEYLLAPRGRAAAQRSTRVLAAGDRTSCSASGRCRCSRSWATNRRFSELRAALRRITPRALALALRELEDARLVRREVLPTRPPSTVYRPTARGRRVHDAL